MRKAISPEKMWFDPCPLESDVQTSTYYQMKKYFWFPNNTKYSHFTTVKLRREIQWEYSVCFWDLNTPATDVFVWVKESSFSSSHTFCFYKKSRRQNSRYEILHCTTVTTSKNFRESLSTESYCEALYRRGRYTMLQGNPVPLPG